jgi:hypothetical protein
LQSLEPAKLSLPGVVTRPLHQFFFERGDAMYPQFVRAGLLLAALMAAIVSVGCERKERVIDIKTPGADVKVDRNIDTGGVEVKTERK